MSGETGTLFWLFTFGFFQQTIENKDNAHDHENPDALYNVVTMLCCSIIGYFILKEIEDI